MKPRSLSRWSSGSGSPCRLEVADDLEVDVAAAGHEALTAGAREAPERLELGRVELGPRLLDEPERVEEEAPCLGRGRARERRVDDRGDEVVEPRPDSPGVAEPSSSTSTSAPVYGSRKQARRRPVVDERRRTAA